MKIIVNNINYDLRPEGAFVLANDYQGDITIPAQIIVDGQPIRVVGIAQEAFYGCDNVILYVYSGSYAEKRAHELEYETVVID